MEEEDGSTEKMKEVEMEGPEGERVKERGRRGVGRVGTRKGGQRGPALAAVGNAQDRNTRIRSTAAAADGDDAAADDAVAALAAVAALPRSSLLP